MKVKPDQETITNWSIVSIVIVVFFGIFGWYGYHVYHEKNIFSSIANDQAKSISLVKQAEQSDHQTTIVIVKSTCPDCLQAHNAIVDSVKQARQDGYSVLVFDANHLTNSQIKQLAEIVPSLKKPADGKVHTPTFTTVKPVKSGHKTYLMATKTSIEGTNNAIRNYFKGVSK